MRTKLSTYKKNKNLKLNQLLSLMKVSEDELFRLLSIWISQGIIPKDNRHYHELLLKREREESQKRNQLSEEVYKQYKTLRRNGEEISVIASKLRKDPERIEKYDQRWFSELKKKNYTNEMILEKTGFSPEQIASLSASFTEKQRLKNDREALSKRQISAFSKFHLKKLKDEIRNPKNYLIIDLEGVQNPDEILEIAIIDFNGEVLLNTLVRPTHNIGYYVKELTGIDDKMAKGGIGLYSLMRKLKTLTNHKTLLSWGSDYDSKLLETASRKTRIRLNCNLVDAQKIHMGLVGSGKQIALNKAAGKEQSHRALEDCMLVLEVLKKDLESEDI